MIRCNTVILAVTKMLSLVFSCSVRPVARGRSAEGERDDWGVVVFHGAALFRFQKQKL